MARWKIIGGPREFDSTPWGHDIDIGWAYDLERDGKTRMIRVGVAGGRAQSSELPDDAVRAIQTNGRSAVTDVLDEEIPPTMLVVHSAGIGRWEPPEQPETGSRE